MFALKAGKTERGRGAAAAYGRDGSPSGFVLPRIARRPARLLRRLVSGEVEAPRYAATMLTVAFLGATSVYGAFLGGHVPDVLQAATARSGFAIDTVRVVGNVETSEIDVLEKVGLDGWTSLVGFDASDARDRIAELPWVGDVSVRKVYPRTVEVELVERKAYAIWQHGRELALVEESGMPIAPLRSDRHVALPLVIGPGAATAAPGFIDRVAAYPELSARVKAYIRIAERRWDLRLENGVTIKLPAVGEDAALAEVAALDREQALLSRDIAAVDLRLADRLVVQLTPDAAVRRDAALVERGLKKAAKTEKRI